MARGVGREGRQYQMAPESDQGDDPGEPLPRVRDPDTFRPMPGPIPRLHYDFVDPGSFLMQRRIRALRPDCVLVGFELRPPPEPLVDPTDPAWVSWWDAAEGGLGEAGLSPARPTLVPWSRKAHELMHHAADTGGDGARAERLRARIFRAWLEGGADIGRIDVLVPLAEAEGFDRTETRAVLDVDRWRDAVEEERRRAMEEGVRGVPTLLHGPRRLEGLHDLDTLRAFLGHE